MSARSSHALSERQGLTKEISRYIIYGWKFHFVADLDSLQMYGPAAGGTFAYICYVIDSQGRTVGQGRGVAELREPQMLNANKAVKMALKRSQVDAVLRCAGLSQWFTQDLEEPSYIAPGAAATASAPAESPKAPEPAERPGGGTCRPTCRPVPSVPARAHGDPGPG
jgi:hypothetical protein